MLPADLYQDAPLTEQTTTSLSACAEPEQPKEADYIDILIGFCLLGDKGKAALERYLQNKKDHE